MDPTIVSFLVSLVSGAVGGNVGGVIAKAKSMGPMWNTILGAIGGVGAGQLTELLGGFGSSGQIGNLGMSAVVGAVLPLIVGYFKNKAGAR